MRLGPNCPSNLLGMGNAMPGGLSAALAIPLGSSVVAYRSRGYGLVGSAVGN
jgi:hypothetical protein